MLRAEGEERGGGGGDGIWGNIVFGRGEEEHCNWGVERGRHSVFERGVGGVIRYFEGGREKKIRCLYGEGENDTLGHGEIQFLERGGKGTISEKGGG